MEKLSMTEQIKALLSDTSGIAGSPEEREKWKKYFEGQRAFEKEIALQLEKENSTIEINKTTWLRKIKEALRRILADTHGECNIPDNVIRDLAKALLPNILAFFESEEGKREFDAWKKQREQATEKVNTNAKKSEA